MLKADQQKPVMLSVSGIFSSAHLDRSVPFVLVSMVCWGGLWNRTFDHGLLRFLQDADLSIFGFLQAGALFGRAFFPPSHLDIWRRLDQSWGREVMFREQDKITKEA